MARPPQTIPEPAFEMTVDLAVESRQLTGDHRRPVDWLLVALIGLLVQAFWAVQISQPAYMDAYYYTTNGQRLASGYGFTENIIWQFLDDPAGLPTASHTYWMPLPSLLAAAGYAAFDGFSGAQLLFWLLGGTLPLLAYAISWQLTGQRWQAWAAALFTAAGGFYAAFLSQPTTFAPFAWAGGLCLLAQGLAGRPDSRKVWWLVSGLTAGLAHLSRADGLLLLPVAGLTWFFTERQRPLSGEDRRRHGLSLLLLLAGYFLIMGGWFAHNWLVIGRPLAGAGLQSAFLTTYDDLFAYGRRFNLDSYLAWGWANILRSKGEALWFGLQTYIAIPGLIFLVPFIIAGLVNLYRRPPGKMLLRPVVWYALAIFLSASLIFTFPGMRGTLFHSSVALWPWCMALAPAGIGLAVEWAGRRLPHWEPEKAKRRFSALFIAVALVLSLVVSQARLPQAGVGDTYGRVAEMLPAGSVVMAGNAPALNYHAGLAAVSVPNEPIDTVLEAADRYGVSYLLLDENRPVPLDAIYHGSQMAPRLKLIYQFEGLKVYEVLVTPEGAG